MLQDLTKPDILRAFATELQKHWYLTQRRLPMDYSGLSLSDAALLHAANDIDFWEAMRKTQPRATYKRNRSRASQLLHKLKQCGSENPYNVLFDKLLLHFIHI